MVLMEEIIALQKPELVAQKQQESGKKVDRGSTGGERHSSKDTEKGKEKKKRITIKEPIYQSKQAAVSQSVSQSKKDGKGKWRRLLKRLLPLDSVQNRKM